MPIIKSLLDTDLYKFTMAQIAFHKFSNIPVEYHYKCRNGAGIPKGIDPAKFKKELDNEIDHLCSLSISEEEIEYLSTLPFFKSDFIDFLPKFRLNRDHVKTSIGADKELNMVIKGLWLRTIWFEVPLLAINSQLYSRYTAEETGTIAEAVQEGRARLEKKIELLKKYTDTVGRPVFIDFGTRRRFSYDWQLEVVETLIKVFPKAFVGTSNVHFAKKFGIPPRGTMAHEYVQAFQQLSFGLRSSQRKALLDWGEEYGDDHDTTMMVALSDTLGFNTFLRDFFWPLPQLYSGIRHDSGDPIEWGEKLIKHYHSVNIDPMTKLAVFSDGLTFEKMIEISNHFYGKINTSFGIGTNLTNDMGFEAPQIVIKMTKCDGGPVAKISDSEGKGMCKDENYLTRLKEVFEIGV